MAVSTFPFRVSGGRTLTQQAVLALEDGSLFYGQSIGADGDTTGEVVFNTSMTGYQEILTDPSYARQVVTLTFPHIGNTGCNDVDEESGQPMAAGLIVRDAPMLHSNWRSKESLQEYLQRHGLVAIAGIDTRRLTRILREKGAQGGCILTGSPADEAKALANARNFPGMKGQDLASVVTTTEPYQWTEGSYELDSVSWKSTAAEFHVVAYDFGIKRNILRMLSDRGCRVTVVPADTPASEVLSMQPDGVFLSNGPGDPEPCDYAISAIQELLHTDLPVFGICLGVQLIPAMGLHETFAMILLPLGLFGIFSGLFLYLNPGQHRFLPAVHGINNLIILVLAIAQIVTGIMAYLRYVL